MAIEGKPEAPSGTLKDTPRQAPRDRDRPGPRITPDPRLELRDKVSRFLRERDGRAGRDR